MDIVGRRDGRQNSWSHLLFAGINWRNNHRGQNDGPCANGSSSRAPEPSIGTALVAQGIESCRGLGTQLVFVLGHAAFYPRFGFQPAASESLHYVDSSLDSHFFVLNLASGSLANESGQSSTIPCSQLWAHDW